MFIAHEKNSSDDLIASRLANNAHTEMKDELIDISVPLFAKISFNNDGIITITNAIDTITQENINLDVEVISYFIKAFLSHTSANTNVEFVHCTVDPSGNLIDVGASWISKDEIKELNVNHWFEEINNFR